jgi:hypothetical protein
MNLPTYCQQNKMKKFLLAETKIRLPAMRHSAESIFVIEYLCEEKSILETASICEPGDTEVLFAEKNEGRKSRDTVPLCCNSRVLFLNLNTAFR